MFTEGIEIRMRLERSAVLVSVHYSASVDVEASYFSLVSGGCTTPSETATIRSVCFLS